MMSDAIVTAVVGLVVFIFDREAIEQIVRRVAHSYKRYELEAHTHTKSTLFFIKIFKSRGCSCSRAHWPGYEWTF